MIESANNITNSINKMVIYDIIILLNSKIQELKLVLCFREEQQQEVLLKYLTTLFYISLILISLHALI